MLVGEDGTCHVGADASAASAAWSETTSLIFVLDPTNTKISATTSPTTTASTWAPSRRPPFLPFLAELYLELATS